MANFRKAYLKTSTFEGGYSNHQSDKGGETYAGISRVNWPKWAGWKIIDRYKGAPHSAKEITRVLSGSVELEDMVEAFYRAHFWKPIMGDDILSQGAADNIYDFAVNSGVGRAVRYAQRIAGAIEDGAMGPKTIKAINMCGEDFVARYKAARIDFINKIVARDDSQRVFLRGWTERVKNA